MFAALFAAIKAFGIWQRVSGAFGTLWQAACQHPVGALLAVSLLGNAWQLFDHREQLRKAARQHTADVAAFSGERAAFTSVLHSYGVIRAALAGQNATITALAAASQVRQNAAQAALGQAAARDAGYQASESALQADAAQRRAQGHSCPDSPAVIAAKEYL